MSNPADDAIEVISLGYGRYQITERTTRRMAFAVVAREAWVFLDGRTYVVSDGIDASSRRSLIEDGDALSAPMPATVLAIHVRPGQQVERNEIVMVLEAMKMELPIRAPRDGVVKTIGCHVGELVQPGTTLLELDQGPPR